MTDFHGFYTIAPRHIHSQRFSLPGSCVPMSREVPHTLGTSLESVSRQVPRARLRKYHPCTCSRGPWVRHGRIIDCVRVLVPHAAFPRAADDATRRFRYDIKHLTGQTKPNLEDLARRAASDIPTAVLSRGRLSPCIFIYIRRTMCAISNIPCAFVFQTNTEYESNMRLFAQIRNHCYNQDLKERALI